jgi:ribosome-associated protein
MEETKEKTLQRETVTIEIASAPTPFAEVGPDVQTAVRCAADKKAYGLVALDLRDIASFTEFFVIASGANQRQTQAISDEIEEQLKKSGTRPIRIEGYQTAEWILMDYGDFVVHIFDKEARGFYDLERLWRDARPVELPTDL